MAYRAWEVALGAAVMLVAAVFVVFALRSTGAALGSAASYDLQASFRSAEGVRPGTEVRLAGVKIGTVTALTLDPQTFRAMLTLGVDQGIELPLDSTIQVAQEGILGGTFIEILPGGDMDNLQPGDSFQDTQSAVSLITLLLRAFTGSDAAADPQ
ncbi:outer membrane lipid asymmetry maintenance protein MlaD [Pararhodobacter sp. CCB-MM2]|uniref:outer membrane lipid asymmetry maintenance protein MlaD n=1 Tax=Pararhodobacter sp. CCB-MM2 TaxID=1786003 RepID=UPI000833536C|nr:outer membrane lipid asymmetry maintenance protein MlaD [Pararhodobacter sp. CCB-MM2]MCA2010364.1 outer membrane lipid asymmetry maintenance protein MlaD [Cereibacter sphaeroides]